MCNYGHPPQWELLALLTRDPLVMDFMKALYH
jgi:hypothetical protein